jgi:hypothetical protein
MRLQCAEATQMMRICFKAPSIDVSRVHGRQEAVKTLRHHHRCGGARGAPSCPGAIGMF